MYSYPEDIDQTLQKAKHHVGIIQSLNTDELFTTQAYFEVSNDKRYFNKNRFNQQFGITGEQGLYIYFETGTPVYVGITRSFKRRLKQHSWGMQKNECTFAYHMMKYSKSTDLEHYRQQVRSFKIYCIEEPDDYDLYFLEVAIAGMLKTKWNSFRTH